MTETAPLVTPRPPARRSLGWAFAAVAVVGAAAVWSSSGAPFDATVTESLETATDDIGSQDSSSNAPHILLVTLDDAGWNDLGYQSEDLSCSAEDEGSHCSNHSYSVTPHMDSLAEAGVKLTGLYGQPSCSPSRAALLTGKWVHKIGFQDLEVEYYSNFSVPLQHTLLPQRLRVAAGYRTYGIGKWNIGHCNAQYLPWARGFDYFLGYFSGGKTYTTHEAGTFQVRSKTGVLRDIKVYDLVEGWDVGNASAAQSSLQVGDKYQGEYDTLLFRDTAMDLIEQHASLEAQSAQSGGSGVPMFMWLAFHATHSDHGQSNDTYFAANQFPTLRRLNKMIRAGNMTKHRYEFARAMMLADMAIGSITASLKTTGLLHKTLVVVHSDNGGQPCTDILPSYNTPLRSTKFQYFEGGIRVPGFIYAPGMLPSKVQGTTYAGLMHHVDWMATFLSLAGADWDSIASEDDLDGVDQWAAITGEFTNNQTQDDFALRGADMRSPRNEVVFDINLIQVENHVRTPVGYENAVIAYRYNDYKLLLNAADDKWYEPSKDYSDTCTGSYCKQVLQFNSAYAQNCSWGAYLFDLRRDPYEHHNLIDELPQVRAELEYRVRLHYEASYVQYASWSSEATDAAHEAFLGASQYVVPWQCDVIL